MQIIYAYFIKSFIVSVILLGYYWIFLRNNRFHQYNRFYLLASLLISILLPLVKFNWFVVDESSVESVKYMVNFIQGDTDQVSHSLGNYVELVMKFSYMAISLCILGIFFIGIWQIYNLKRKSVVQKMNGVDFMNTENESAPFSFLNNIFWKRTIDLTSIDGQKIFRHELTHVLQNHTYDKLVCNVAISVFWINPVFWITRNELNNIHEFIADEQSLNEMEISEFSRLMLEVHFGKSFFHAGQNFFHSSIKRRLQMFKKSKQIKFSYMRRLMVVPLLLLTVSLFSFTLSERAASEIDFSVRKLEDNFSGGWKLGNDSLPTPPTPPLTGSSTNPPNAVPPPPPLAPKKPGSPKHPMVKKIKISKSSDVTHYDSVVMVKGKGKEVIHFTPVTLNGLNNGETVVVWKGNEVFTDKAENLSKYDHQIATIDILGPEKAAYMFGYKGKEKITVIHLKPQKIAVKPTKKGKKNIEKSLIILEGKEITSEEMNKLDQSTIESINVWKGEKAVEKFGAKGKHGVIEITLKKQ